MGTDSPAQIRKKSNVIAALLFIAKALIIIPLFVWLQLHGAPMWTYVTMIAIQALPNWQTWAHRPGRTAPSGQ